MKGTLRHQLAALTVAGLAAAAVTLTGSPSAQAAATASTESTASTNDHRGSFGRSLGGRNWKWKNRGIGGRDYFDRHRCDRDFFDDDDFLDDFFDDDDRFDRRRKCCDGDDTLVVVDKSINVD